MIVSRTKESAKADTSVQETKHYETKHYEDKGCQASPSCLTCPLPQCKYDDPASFNKLKQVKKDLGILNEMQAENLTVNETAKRFSVSTQTILRILRRSPESGAKPSIGH